MLKAIKHFFKLFFMIDKIRVEREWRQIKTFDLVSQVPDPRPSEVQLVYAIGGTETQTIYLSDYFKTGKCQATPDNLLVYPNNRVGDLLYKIADRSFNPLKIISACTPEELKNLADRMTRAYTLDTPVLGMFMDPSIQHMMFIVSKRGDAETGCCVVTDLTTAMGYGINHLSKFAGVVRTKDLMNKQVIRPFGLEDLVILLSRPWDKDIINSLVASIFDSIWKSECKFDKFKLYAKDLVYIEKLQGGNSSMNLEKSPDPTPTTPNTPVEPRGSRSRKVKT